MIQFWVSWEGWLSRAIQIREAARAAQPSRPMCIDQSRDSKNFTERVGGMILTEQFTCHRSRLRSIISCYHIAMRKMAIVRGAVGRHLTQKAIDRSCKAICLGSCLGPKSEA